MDADKVVDALAFEKKFLSGMLTGTPEEIGKEINNYLEAIAGTPNSEWKCRIKDLFEYLRAHRNEMPAELIAGAFEKLIRNMGEEDCHEAVAGFGGIDRGAIPVILDVFKKGDINQRLRAARIVHELAKKQIPEVTEALLWALENVEIGRGQEAKYENLVLLGITECAGVGQRLLELILHEKQSVAIRAAMAVNRYSKSRYATPEVIGFARRCAENDKTDAGVLTAAYDTLASAGKDPMEKLMKKLRNGEKREKLKLSKDGFSGEVRALVMDKDCFAVLKVIEALACKRVKIEEKYLEEIAALLAFENPRKSMAIVTFADHASEVGRIACGILKNSKNERFITMAVLAHEKDEEYAAEIGMEKVGEILRDYDRIVRARYPETVSGRIRREMAAFYARVAEQICGRKQDVPMEDTELARLARQRMKQLAAEREKGKPRFSQQLKRAVA